MLNTTTTLNLDITAKTVNNAASITGVAVPQKFKVGGRQLSYGSTTITGGFITKSYTTSVSSSVSNLNKMNESTNFTVTSITPFNELVKIATLTITPDTNYRIVSDPTVTITSGKTRGLRMKLKKATATTWDIMANVVAKVSSANNIKVLLNYSIAKIPVALTNIISKFDIGLDTISNRSSVREIKVFGAPNTPFELSILDSNNKSVLKNPNNANILPVGFKACHAQKLNKQGYYTYRHKFPDMSTVLTTSLDGTVSDSGGGSYSITVLSVSGLQVGDQLFITDSNNRPWLSGLPIKVIVINEGSKLVTLSAPVHGSSGKKMKFKRPDTYKINIETSGTKGPNIPVVFPTYTLSQKTDSMVTLRTSCTAPVQINGESAGSTVNIYHGVREGNLTDMRVTITLTGKTFNLVTNKPTPSDFRLGFGDAEYTVRDIVVTGNTTSTMVIKAKIQLSKVGPTDPIIFLNINDIIS